MRVIVDMLFLYFIVNRRVESCVLCQQVSWHEEVRPSRKSETFVRPFYRANYGAYSWVPRISRLGNAYPGFMLWCMGL